MKSDFWPNPVAQTPAQSICSRSRPTLFLFLRPQLLGSFWNTQLHELIQGDNGSFFLSSLSCGSFNDGLRSGVDERLSVNAWPVSPVRCSNGVLNSFDGFRLRDETDSMRE